MRTRKEFTVAKYNNHIRTDVSKERPLSVFSLSVPVGELPEEKRSVNADLQGLSDIVWPTETHRYTIRDRWSYLEMSWQ